jgi:beta-lactamase superfamily II metal-dependent hydrolase
MAWIALYYAAAALLVFAPLPKLRKQITMGAAAIALIVMLWAPGLGRHRPPAGHLRISLIDVGQGDAILVQSPFGQALLVDAGGGPGSYDIGTRVVTPAVWSLGDRVLTWLAVTHGDRDHAGGAVGVADDLDPREIWEGVPARSAPDLARLRQLASDRGMVWRSIRAGTRIAIGSIEIDAIHPPGPEWERPRRGGPHRRCRRGIRAPTSARSRRVSDSHPEGRPSRQPHVDERVVDSRNAAAGRAHQRRPWQSVRASVSGSHRPARSRGR